MTDNETLRKLLEPPVLVEREQFLIKFAETQQEVEAALRLRYQVFMNEQGHFDGALPKSGIDADEFDPYCLHMIIVDRARNTIAGTYRIHPGEVARQGIGFYSEREYAITGLDAIADRTIEVGRSCVSPEFRNGVVVALLWSGMAVLMRRAKARYLLGCVSLETQDPAVGWALYRDFQNKDAFTTFLQAVPQKSFVLPEDEEPQVREYLTGSRQNELSRWVPPLLKGYLRLGAKLVGKPVLDREFGAIDFLVLFDLEKINEKYARHFL